MKASRTLWNALEWLGMPWHRMTCQSTFSPCRVSTTEGRASRRALLSREQVAHVDTESEREPIDAVDRDVALRSLDGSNVGAVQLSDLRKSLLRETKLQSQ